jgi:general secretion pathway protein D
MQRLARLTAFAVLVIVGCTSTSNQRMAEYSEREGDWDQAVLYYLELVQDDPGNIAYRGALMRAKISASQMHFERGKEYRDAGILDQAMIEFQQAVQLDTTNQYAQVELRKAREEVAASVAGEDVLSIAELKDKVREQRRTTVLNPRSDDPISLDFPEPVSVQDIYRAVGKGFGINVIFDPNLRDQEIAITLQDVLAKDALEILMRSAGHFYKVLDEHSILIAADTPQNRRAYEDLVIQTFFLSNAEPKDSFNMLRSLVGAKNIATNEQLNAIVIRDTADRVKVAERIIQTNDKSRGEVVVDVELLQVNTNSLLDLGLSLSEYRVTSSLEPNPIQMSELSFVNQSNWMLTIPSFIYDFVKNSSDAELLARPQLRISDGEKASLHIGEQVPIPVTSFNTANTVGANIVPVTSFSYQDVGIRIDLEPRIHHNQEVTLVIQVEFSQVSGEIEGTQGQAQPIIGTRKIESTIRLRDGETNFLAGLIRTDEINSKTGIPGLSEIPIIGRLFGKVSTQTQRTDLVLTITPHIVRSPDITAQDLEPIWVGTEANITFRGGSPQVESDAEGPFDTGDDNEQLQEMIRQRLENLPRGLRDQEGGAETAAPTTNEGVVPEPGRNLLDDGDDDDGDGGLASNWVRLQAPPLRMAGPVLRPALASLKAQESAPEATSELVRFGFSPRRKLRVPLDHTFEVSLMVSARTPVAHLPVTLLYDAEVVEIEAVYEGDFFAGIGTVLADHSTPGRLVIGASQLGPGLGREGSGSVVTIHFRAKKEGVTNLRFEESSALDHDLRPVGPVRNERLRLEADPDAPPPAGQRPERPARPRVA